MATEENVRTMPRPFEDDETQENKPPGILDHLRQYATDQPEVAALWCFGIGFVLGWKLKPW